MDKKPHKVGEPKAPNVAKQTADTAIPSQAPAGEFTPRYADEATARKTIEKLLLVHKDLLRRLAEYDRNG